MIASIESNVVHANKFSVKQQIHIYIFTVNNNCDVTKTWYDHSNQQRCLIAVHSHTRHSAQKKSNLAIRKKNCIKIIIYLQPNLNQPVNELGIGKLDK